MHNAIDRFTGGVRDRLLFGEDLLWRTPIRVSVLVNTRAGEGEDVVELERGLAGLRLALNDLLEGRLALGAGSGKGHGYFLGAEPADLAGLTMGRDHDGSRNCRPPTRGFVDAMAVFRRWRWCRFR